jgi:uncharacterized protein (DUF2267 family)
MNYNDFVRSVAGATGLTRKQADEAVVNTLTVLAEIVSASETKDLLAQLPKSIRERVPVSGETLPMRPIELVARVADLGGGSLEDTERHVRAVFRVLTEAVNAGEMNDIATELGEEYADLLERDRPTSPPTGGAEDARGPEDLIGAAVVQGPPDEPAPTGPSEHRVQTAADPAADEFRPRQPATVDLAETVATSVAHVVHGTVSLALRPAVAALRRLHLVEH